MLSLLASVLDVQYLFSPNAVFKEMEMFSIIPRLDSPSCASHVSKRAFEAMLLFLYPYTSIRLCQHNLRSRTYFTFLSFSILSLALYYFSLPFLSFPGLS